MANPNSFSVRQFLSNEQQPRPAGCAPGTEPAFSVLFTDGQRSVRLSKNTPPQPGYFVDLNLDQAIDAIIAARQEYNLAGIFRSPLCVEDDAEYRHEVFRDLEEQPLLRALQAFAAEMRKMREHLVQAEKLHYPYQEKRWHIEAVMIYCTAVGALNLALTASTAKSRAIGLELRKYVSAYVDSKEFTTLFDNARALLSELDAIAYSIHISGDTLSVCHYDGEPDYSAVIEEAFRKFRQGAVHDHRIQFHEYPDMNGIEAKVLEFVALLNPEIFRRLDELREQSKSYLDPTIAEFDREIQFYLAYLEHMALFSQAGRSFCYPRISDSDKHVYAKDCFDIALGKKLLSMNKKIVCNDFELKDGERMIVVSGPNQGGKTTFARMFGQMFFLAAMGCPVPGTEARLLLSDSIFTHFERQENIDNLRGKLKDDLVRIHQILTSASPRSILVMNEIFTSTSLTDGLYLSQKVMEKAIELDVLGVWVTFIDELASYGDSVVSMVSSVDPSQTVRTFKIVRARATGRSYAMALAQKYGLLSEHIKERVQS